MSLTVKAYGKINLWLDITGRRDNGYHTLNTVMHRIDLYDDVEVETRSGSDITVECDVPGIPCDSRNIAYRAAKLFAGRMGKDVGAVIRIHKRIPVGAGLGGSSADGAAVLTAMNELCGRPIDTGRLCELGAELGADVPFCIVGGTAVCTGIGEIMQPVDCTDFSVLIAVPQFQCSTAAAYRAYDCSPIPVKTGFEDFYSKIGNDRSYLTRNMYNIFEKLYDDFRIEEMKRRITDAGAEGTCMTGSGSAVFGIFSDISEAKAAAAKLGDDIIKITV